MSTWSGIRNKLENDYLCPALRGHIQYFATSYSKSADHEGRAAIRMDGVEVLRSNYYIYFENVWTKFHHLRSTTLKDHDCAKEAINQAHAFALEQGTFDQKVFYEAFGIFDNQSIEKSLVSENPLVRIFALLDRRLGKRRLLALEDSMEQELDWVRGLLCDPDAGRRADVKRITFRRNCHVTDRILLSSQRRPAAGTVQRRLLRRGLYGHLGLV